VRMCVCVYEARVELTATRFQDVGSSAIVQEAIEHFYAIHDPLPSLLGEFYERDVVLFRHWA